MLPPPATKALEHLTTTVVTFVVLMVIVSAVAALLARHFDGTSRAARQTIFGIVSFVGLFAVALYSFSKLSAGS